MDMTSKPINLTGWTGDDLLQLFMKNNVDDHVPRPTTGNVRKEGNVMTVQQSDTLSRVFRELTTEGFLGAPVLDGKKYVGFISMIDLVKYTNSLFVGHSVEEWIDFWEKSDDFSSATVKDIMETPDKWSRDPFPPTQSNFSSFHALETMAITGMHRIAVLDPDTQRVNGIITQSMLLSFLRQIKPHWGSFANIKVSSMTKDLKVIVHTAKESERAINAFNRMEDEEVSGLPVVNEEGVLVGSISARDLRAVGTSGEHFFRLYKTIKELKALERGMYPKLTPKTHYSRSALPTSALFVTPNDTMERVIDLMHDGNIHRVFVCDSKINPVPRFVISQKDVLMLVLNYIKHQSGTPPRGTTRTATTPPGGSTTTARTFMDVSGPAVSGVKHQREQASEATTPRHKTRTIQIM